MKISNKQINARHYNKLLVYDNHYKYINSLITWLIPKINHFRFIASFIVAKLMHLGKQCH